MTIPITFAWVAETATTFNPSTMNVFDEEIISFALKHDEGQIPTLEIIVKNPRIGLLSPGRDTWAWFGWYNAANSAYEPLFFGVLIGVPTSLFAEKVTLQFQARSKNFIANKQALAETMKTFPFYDPIWLETGKRDDPDTILEGWSALWHVDRLTGAITHSDVLTGEDGNVEFLESQALYDSVSLTLGQPPLNNVRMEATVNWTQRSAGYFTIPDVVISSYTGGSLMSDWPKAGASIGGGYKCEAAFSIDTYFIDETPTTSYNSSWTNTDPDPGQCSNASAQNSSSGPALLSPNPLTAVLTGYLQSGVCFPDSDPPQNIPLHMQSSGIIVPLWNVDLSMTIRYDASRQYSEVLSFDMIANTQGILASPLVSQNTELITISSVDVGKPLIDVDAWTDFAGQAVQLAQVIFPNNPTTPGGLAYQICVSPGTAGTVEPTFSDIPGETTDDNGVIWSSLGGQTITDPPDWSSGAFVPLGQIILLQNTSFNPATGNFEDIPGESTYYICTGAGVTNGIYTTMQYTPPVTSNVEATPAEITISFIAPPSFDTSVGAQVADGSVVWTVLGTSPALLGIPIGGTADTVTANNFFPTARGIVSIEYLVAKVRARLRFRARAVTVGWDCPFALATGLSCRMNATLFDPRLPGGGANGKIVSYSLTGDGDGKFRGHVEIGCAIGFGGAAPSIIPGTPQYASSGYVTDNTYQQYDGGTILNGSYDTTYTVPHFVPFDDGLTFPLTWAGVSDGGTISGNLADQAAAITASFAAARTLAFLNTVGGSISQTPGGGSSTVTGQSPETAWQITREQIALTTQNTPYVMAAHPISWNTVLKPCSGNGPFGGSYAITVSPLVVPQGINLEAMSSG